MTSEMLNKPGLVFAVIGDCMKSCSSLDMVQFELEKTVGHESLGLAISIYSNK